MARPSTMPTWIPLLLKTLSLTTGLLVPGRAQERLRSFAGNSEINRRSHSRAPRSLVSLFVQNRSAAAYQRGKRRCCSTDRGCFNSRKSQLTTSSAFGIDWIRGSLCFMDKPAFRTSQRPVLEAGSSRYSTQHLHVRSAHRTALPLGFTSRVFIIELRVGHGRSLSVRREHNTLSHRWMPRDRTVITKSLRPISAGVS
jgi:hypothetical protein